MRRRKHTNERSIRRKMIKQVLVSLIQNMCDLHSLPWISSDRKKNEERRKILLSVKVASACWIWEISLFFIFFPRLNSLSLSLSFDIGAYIEHNDDQSTFNVAVTSTMTTTTMLSRFDYTRTTIDYWRWYFLLFLLFHSSLWCVFKNKYSLLFSFFLSPKYANVINSAC